MRMRKNLLKTYHYSKRIAKKDKEGSSYSEYGDPLPFEAIIWPAQGRVQAEIYGERLRYILNMKTLPDVPLNELDGITVYDQKPDYQIVSIKCFTDHSLYELEKL